MKSSASFGHWEFPGRLGRLAEQKSDKGFLLTKGVTCAVLAQLFSQQPWVPLGTSLFHGAA